MDFLTQVAKHHDIYVRNVVNMGAGSYAEDIVQEMYLRLDKYSAAEKCITNGKVNKHYIWRILYSLSKDYFKESNKVKNVDLDTVYSLSVDQEDTEKEDAYERVMQKMFRELDNLDTDEGYKYNKELFTLYADSLMSMRKLSAATNISLTSIFHTLKNCKIYLSDELSEDIEDFNNGDYELIK